jgi:hypothetical protein
MALHIAVVGRKSHATGGAQSTRHERQASPSLFKVGPLLESGIQIAVVVGGAESDGIDFLSEY